LIEPLSPPAHEVDEGLRAALNPLGIALIGASNRETNLMLRFARALVRHGYEGNLRVINRTGEDVEGIPGHKSIADAEGPLDLAIVGVRADAAIEAVESAAAAGIRTVVMFTSGFAEVGGEGVELQRRLVEVASEAGVCLIGPNCVGVANVHQRMVAIASGFGFRPEIQPGDLAVVTQSGGVAGLLGERAQDLGIGLSHIITTGNEAQVTVARVIEHLVADGVARQMAIYLEAVREPQRLADALQAATEAGIAVAVFKAGSGPQTVAAAAAHTGAVVGDDATFDALFRQTGVYRAHELDELFLVPPIVARLRGAGRRVGILSTSGGAAVAVADACERLELELPPLADDTIAAIAEVAPGFASSENPLDITGTFVVAMDQFRRSLAIISAAPEFDTTVMVQTVHPPDIADAIADVVISGADPARMVVVWIAGSQSLAARKRLREAGFAVSESAGVMAKAIAAAGAASAAPVSLRAGRTGPVDGELRRPSRALELLAERGAPVTPMIRASSADEVVEAGAKLGYPVVLKADSPSLAHKTERGGVLLGIADEVAARAGYERLSASGIADDGVLVQRTKTGNRELLLTARVDPVFGVVLAVGFGGVLTEAVGRATILIPPITPAALTDAMEQADLGVLLGGFRGAAPVDMAALTSLGSALVDLATDLGDVRDLELNPVIVDAHGKPWVVDALVDFGAA
jgi:acyl-CoA synthetase (NDP forming)